MTKKVVVIAAGGTGGHLFPAAAFAEEMFRRDWRVILMTDARGRRYAEGFPAERIEDVSAASISMNPITAFLQGLHGEPDDVDYPLVAFRCPSCAKVELYAPPAL